MNILDMLKEEHRQIETLMDVLMRTSSDDANVRRDGLATCEHALLVQMEFEEALLYPTLRLHSDETAAECTLDAYAQNYAIADLLSRLMLMPPDDEVWRSSLRVIKDNLERHHRAEEQQIFERLAAVIDDATLEGLGQRYEALHDRRATERRDDKRGRTYASVSSRRRPLERSPFAAA